MPKHSHKESTPRSLRVGEEIRHALARIFERDELRDPALQGVALTVTEVRVSPDLKNATVFVMPLGGEQSERAVAALRRGSAFLRKLVAQEVLLRYTPGLAFELDRSFDQASHINELLHRPEVVRDLVDREEDDGEEGGEEEPSDGADDRSAGDHDNGDGA